MTQLNGNSFDANKGLTTSQAKDRLQAMGKNELASAKRQRAGVIFLSQFRDVMVLILLASTIISVLLGEWVEAIAIVCVVFLNACLGFFQEYRTEKTLEALKQMASPHSKVLREGKVSSIESSMIVPGDIVLLDSGDIIPADGVVLEGVDLHADESMLTGESEAVYKEGIDPARAESAPKRSRVFMGTTVTRGRGRMVVAQTGMGTQMGSIASMLEDIEEDPTPLQKKLAELSKYIGAGCLIICAIVTLTGILRGEPVFDMLVTGISLAVAAVPEGLPAIVTIALALAVRRMVKRNALVRKLHAVETLGCASVICSDKTGTLTENKMTVVGVQTMQNSYQVSGTGYEQAGLITQNGAAVVLSQHPALERLLDIAVLCNNAEIYGEEAAHSLRDRTKNNRRGIWEISGEATEVSLLVMAAKRSVTANALAREYTRVYEIPFDSSRKCMSVGVRHKTLGNLLYTKGALDVIIQNCAYVLGEQGREAMTDARRKAILQQGEALAEQGLRVLGFAYKEQGDVVNRKDEQGLCYVGLCSIMDPPRKEAFDAVKRCRRAGIRPIMITGDHKKTAQAIARQLDILREGDLTFTGRELDQMDDKRLQEVVSHASVFARVTPWHKLRIVKALKARGFITAMTGDGVNDAPAIKEADIGVAMGQNGTDVTKEASSIILLDDNFATLVRAVEEGRGIYRNIRKFIRYLLSCNIGEVVTMFVGMLMGFPVILLPIQILLVNLVTDGLPALALGVEPIDPDVMKEPPRKKNEGVFSHGLLSMILFRGALLGLTTLWVFTSVFASSQDLGMARTAALFTLVITQLIHVFECKSEEKSLFKIPLFNNIKLVLAVLFSLAILLCAIYLPFCNVIFVTAPLPAKYILRAVLCSFVAPVLSALLFNVLLKPKRQVQWMHSSQE